MLESSPTVTSPLKTAVGATNAFGDIFGLRPLYSMIMEATSAEVVSGYGKEDAKSIPQAEGRRRGCDDALADREGSRCTRRRRFQHMDFAAGLPNDEVVEQRAVRRNRLRAHARAARLPVVDPDRRHQALPRSGEGALAERPVLLLESHAPVASRDRAEAGEGKRLPEIARVEIGFAVALAREGQHGVRARLDVAVDRAREMYAEKRKAGVGYGIDEPSDQRGFFRRDFVVLAAEGNNLHVDAGEGLRRHLGDAVREEPAAVDEKAPAKLLTAGADDHLVAGRRNIFDGTRREDVTAGRAHVFRVGLGHLYEVDDAGRGRMNRAHAARVRLDLFYPLRADHLKAGNPIRGPAPVKLFEPRQLAVIRGDDDLAAKIIGDAVLIAELQEFAAARYASRRFQRTGLVVDAAVNNAAVVAGLVARQLGFFFEDDQSQAREALGHLHRGGETDDAASDHDDVVCVCHTVRRRPPQIRGGHNLRAARRS